MIQLNRFKMRQLLVLAVLALTGCGAASNIGSSTSSSTSPLVVSSGQTTDTSTTSTPIGNWLTHVYKTTFNRAPDAAGLSYWTSVYNQGYGCRSITQGILQASENTLRNELLSDSTDPTFGALYVHELYSVLLNRDADQSGSNYWVSALQNGVSVASVESGFLNSSEFQSVCNSFGIN